MTVVMALCLLAGSGATLSAALGMLRLPDLLTRMHAAVKPQAVGLILILVAVAINFPAASVITTILLVALLQLVTVPVAAHMVGRAAYRTGRFHQERLHVDELAEDLGD
ncbi:monovalent cation/H(+) antiporter subunit G [Actinomadura sp. 9N407]|uniref:monovalent cation/H(+) antiporter subunit G n=1 Tax=Actinomadura sp. 9N407 TaxID=3375154 RepID=UPI0037878797